MVLHDALMKSVELECLATAAPAEYAVPMEQTLKKRTRKERNISPSLAMSVGIEMGRISMIVRVNIERTHKASHNLE